LRKKQEKSWFFENLENALWDFSRVFQNKVGKTMMQKDAQGCKEEK
jgi:hypothetical protein